MIVRTVGDIGLAYIMKIETMRLIRKSGALLYRPIYSVQIYITCISIGLVNSVQ